MELYTRIMNWVYERKMSCDFIRCDIRTSFTSGIHQQVQEFKTTASFSSMFLCAVILRAAGEKCRGTGRGLFRKFCPGIILKQNHEKGSFVFTILDPKGKSHCRTAELYLSFAACTVPRFSCVWTRQVSRDVSANAGILYDEPGMLRDTINGTLGKICR